MAAAIKAGASDLELDDMREEMGMIRYVTDPVEQQEYRTWLAGLWRDLHFPECW